ncbi:LTA synthase family protein [Clostridium sp.]|uniref:LTA synthase family protein n=1 Tax=Clostridium sp. TaxID=1506 RepID=UPI002FC8302D
MENKRLKNRVLEVFRKDSFKETSKDLLLWLIGGILLTLFIEMLQRGSFFSGIEYIWTAPLMFLLNLLLVLTITGGAFLFRKTWTSYFIFAGLLLCFSLASGVMLKLRGTPLIFADIYSVKEGLMMAQNYLSTGTMLLALGLVVTFGAIIFILWKKQKINKSGISRYFKWQGIAFLVFAAIITFSLDKSLSSSGKKVVYFWDMPYSYKQNGLLVSFGETAKAFNVKPPEGYTKESIEGIQTELSSETISVFSGKDNKVNTKPSKTPNIIGIQLESFMNPEHIPGIKMKSDVLKNYNKMFNSYPNGVLNVPCYGGGTVRSEFEVLTGLNTDFLPVGEIPNNNILKKQTVESMAYILGDNGYNTSVVHNYTANFYDRDLVYPNLGFENYIAMEYMKKPENLDKGEMYPEDMVNLDTMKELINKKEPQFIYNITVESHGSYSEKLINEDFEVVDKTLDPKAISQIQGLINKLKGVDAYLGELMKFIESTNEPTAVVVFSDHLPSLDALNKEGALDSKKKYQTEYFIWNNLGFEKTSKELEAYEISSYLFDLIDMKDGIIPTFHNKYSGSKEYEETYKNLQYDMLYGEKYIFGGKLYKKSNMKMGLHDIKVKEYYVEGNNLVVKGENFNYKTGILVNGKLIPTKFIDENTVISKEDVKSPKKISTGQIGKNDKILSKTNELE